MLFFILMRYKVQLHFNDCITELQLCSTCQRRNGRRRRYKLYHLLYLSTRKQWATAVCYHKTWAQ